MRQGIFILTGVVALLLSQPAAALPEGAFDPRAYHAQVAGERTQILILASPHISGAPDTFDPASLEPLLARLGAFQPDVIAIENLGGEEVQTLMTFTGAYPGVVDDYATRIMALMSAAHEATGLDIAAADLEVRATLRTLPDAPSAAQRRRLAAVMMAAGDPLSALVQWRRLAPADRAAGADFPESLVTGIEALSARRNESQMIGAELAARGGLERVYPMDDHTADDITADIEESLWGQIQNDPAFQALINAPEFQFLSHAPQHLGSADEVLATYRRLNAPETGVLDASGQWLPMLARAWPQNAGRKVIASWETRNLRMAAHIREAAGAAPGGRVLVIVGSAHKAWLDAYLELMSDVEIVDMATILN